MKKIILLFVVAFTFLALFSQSLTISYVNGYKILQGERPAIHIRDFPVDAYEQGKIKIKINRSYEQQLPDIDYRAYSEGFVKTGIVALDALNAQFQAKSYAPLFSALYETNSRSAHFRERHKAWGFHLWFTIELDKNVSIADAVEAYQALHLVEVAEPFYHTVLHAEENDTKWLPDDPRLNNQWHYNNTGQSNGTPGADISLFQAWEIEKGNDKVIVAVIDCGINQNHPDLQGNMWPEIGYNFYNNIATIEPGGHGCHTGGTIAAVTNNGVGVAGIAGGSGSNDGVRLMTCQVFNTAGNSGSRFADAFIYAADNGACISQNSWGYSNPNAYEIAVLNAIDYFMANGGGEVMADGIVIFAAGNDNSNAHYYPGYYAPVLTVAATTNTDTRASYSNYGTWVNISAPGGQTYPVSARGVLSCTVNSYSYYQGTSMACPHVSGAAALLVSRAAREEYLISRQEIWDLLVNNTDDISALNPSGGLGAGRLNAHKALLDLLDLFSAAPNPNNITASSISYSKIELRWNKNKYDNNVMIIAHTVNEFGTPTEGTSYQVGDVLPEGGDIIYFGDAATFIHSGLNTSTTYFYKFFSYSSDYEYSRGVNRQATTLCKSGLPLFEGFEEGMAYCWEQEKIAGHSLWVHGKGNGGTYPGRAYEGESNIYLKMTNPNQIGDVTRIILPSIDMINFNNVKLSFALHNQSRNGEATDELSIYYRISTSQDWVLWKEYKDNQDSWLLDSIAFPEAVDTEELSICFQGKINGGYGVCLDNISVKGFNVIGIKENDLDNKINIYPNPTTGELRIENGELRIKDVEVFDVYGRKISSHHLITSSSNHLINISHLPAGIYFVKITTDKGIITKKLIKH